MPLPKLSHPVFSITDYEGKPWTFRPMFVKEEKVLLMAKESADETDILSAIKQVVGNCCVDRKFNVDQVPLFELENFFLKLRAFSIGEEVKVAYKDFEDTKVYNFTINLKNVEFKRPDKINKKVAVTSTSGVVMRFPRAEIYDSKEYLKSEGEQSLHVLIAHCIEQVYDGERVYEAKDFTTEELMEFIELLDIKSFQSIREFMSNLPTLYYRIEYENTLKNKRTIELTSLSDFFTLR